MYDTISRDYEVFLKQFTCYVELEQFWYKLEEYKLGIFPRKCNTAQPKKIICRPVSHIGVFYLRVFVLFFPTWFQENLTRTIYQFIG